MNERFLDVPRVSAGDFLWSDSSSGCLLPKSIQHSRHRCRRCLFDFHGAQRPNNVRDENSSCPSCAASSACDQSRQRSQSESDQSLVRFSARASSSARRSMRRCGDQDDRKHYVGHFSAAIHVRLHGRSTIQSQAKRPEERTKEESFVVSGNVSFLHG